MLNKDAIRQLFFLGIGGIGMSALARYFCHQGYPVYGYDRTPSPLTRELEQEGMSIDYTDDLNWLAGLALSPSHTLVVRTPAVPEDNSIYTSLRAQGFDIRKRSEVLGLITRQMKALCVAGTHGKTTTSTMLAHLMGGNAFLGGISMNYGTNVLLNKESEFVVVEADEYDRSFHHLAPFMSVVSAVDPDHLDIYGTPEAYREAFAHYTSLISGALVMKQGIDLHPRLRPGVKCYTYGVIDTSREACPTPDFYADRIRVTEGKILFDFHAPAALIADVELGVPVWVNIENAVAAMAVAWLNGIPSDRLKAGIASFRGVQRRFNIHVNSPSLAYIDDYAHHPQEIATAIDSIRKLYPGRKLIGIFQPHLYTRTRDFAQGFEAVLSTLDECILLPVYPAREKPIPGIDSEMLQSRIQASIPCRLVQKNELTTCVRALIEEQSSPVVLLTVGAGDIDRLVPEITHLLLHNSPDPN